MKTQHQTRIDAHGDRVLVSNSERYHVVDDTDEIDIRDENGLCVAHLCHATDDEGEASQLETARILAAAPELLAACKAQVQWHMADGSPCACPLGREDDEPSGILPPNNAHATSCQMLRAAIASATNPTKKGK